MGLTLRCDEHGERVAAADTNLVLSDNDVAIVCNSCLADTFTREHDHRATTR